MTTQNFGAFLGACVRLGVIGRERFHFWGLMLWTCYRRPRLVPTAVSLSWHPIIDDVFTVSADGFVTARTLNGRQTYAATYDSGQMKSETDENGVMTSYQYDARGKIWYETRAGVPASGNYVAQTEIKTSTNAAQEV